MIAEWPRRVAALSQLRVLDLETPVLSQPDNHHLRRVLRAKDGEEVVLCDGRGAWRFARVAHEGLEPVSDVVLDPTPPATTLYLAPLKGERGEWALAKATEVGISTVVPLVSGRLAHKFRGEARDKFLARWRRISDETCAQCRRTYDLVIAPPLTPADVPADVCVADFSGEGDWSAVRAIAVGPEGGWAPGEWGPERRRLSLGPTVLRGETAAVLAAALVTFAQGSWGFTLSAMRMSNDESTT